MAIVKPITLTTLKTLGKTVTFSTQHGQFIARNKMGKLGPARTKPKRYSTNLMRAACLQMKNLTAEDRAAWRRAAVGSSFTWKDLYISRWFITARERNQPPLLINHIVPTAPPGDVQIDFMIGNYIIIDETGWGSIAWGSHPYGAAEKYNVAAGSKLIIDYHVDFTHPIPQPRHDQSKSVFARTLCLTPVPPDPFEIHDPDLASAFWIDNPGTVQEGSTVRSISSSDPACAVSEQESWDSLMSDPVISSHTWPVGRLWLEAQKPGADWLFKHEYAIAKFDYDMSAPLNELYWPLVDDLKFDLAWFPPPNLSLWKVTATLDLETQVLTEDDAEVHFSVTPLATLKQLTLDQNNVQHASVCPLPDRFIITSPSGWDPLRVHVKEHASQVTWRHAPPTLEDFTTRLSQRTGYPPVLCPPILVE